jgi:MarR family 2-MHQ and catechol resistance regulon transcriptional repressor
MGSDNGHQPAAGRGLSRGVAEGDTGGLSAWLEDPLAHRALDALVRVESRLVRRLGSALERRGLSAPAFAMLVVLASAGGSLELRTVRLRLGLSKASATELAGTLAEHGLVRRERSIRDRRAVVLWLTPRGDRLVQDLFPDHARRVRDAFTVLDDDEKRELAKLCRKLDRAA